MLGHDLNGLCKNFKKIGQELMEKLTKNMRHSRGGISPNYLLASRASSVENQLALNQIKQPAGLVEKIIH